MYYDNFLRAVLVVVASETGSTDDSAVGSADGSADCSITGSASPLPNPSLSLPILPSSLLPPL